MDTIAELLLGREPDAVPRARRAVCDALTATGVASDRPGLCDDAELVVSELVTNAVLHGEAPIAVRVRVGGGVRIEVEDAGRTAPILLQGNPDSMTGRGLSMVSALTSGWGVEPAGGGGKIIWAELGGNAPSGRVAQPVTDIDSLLAAWSDDGEDPPAPNCTVRLGSVPTELLLSAKSHIDNVVRELMLLREGESSSGVALPPEMASLIETVTVDFAGVRAEVKRQAAAAAARRDVLTDLELHLDPRAADTATRYLEALDRADRYARSAHLLTMASPHVHRLFRQWYVGAVVDQVQAQAAGRTPPPARPFQLVLVDEVTRLADEAAVSSRLALLQEVTGRLSEARTVEEMARVVVEGAVGFLGVETARVRLLSDGGMLRTIAAAGREGPGPEPMPEIAVDSDLPAGVVARTRRPMFMKSLTETFGGVAAFDGHYPDGRSGYAMPLAVGDRTVGILSLTYVDGELTDETQIAFVESLADLLASALRRGQLAASDAEKQETLSFLSEATGTMISASDPAEVLERLVRLAVPRLGDWCTVYLAEGDRLRRVAMAIDGHPEIAGRLKGASTLALDPAIPHVRAYLTGRTEFMAAGVGRLLEGLYPDLEFASLGGDAAGASGLAVPLVLRDRRIGVIGLTFLGSQRRATDHLIEAFTGLADRAAIALDNADRWEAQRLVVRALVDAVLPAQPPEVPGVGFAARYLPADGEVAGDWWESEVLPDGAVLVGLGDAAGHGLPAVSQMSELRHGARALAAVESSPAALLDDLNRRLSGVESGFATAVYGRYHPGSGRLDWSSAGHVPPLHVSAGGKVTVLDGVPDTPLGVPRSHPGSDRVLHLAPGDTLVLYSDGVVERRLGGIDQGIDRLLATVEAHAGDGLDEMADAVMVEHCANRDDDCCLLLLRRAPGPASLPPSSPAAG